MGILISHIFALIEKRAERGFTLLEYCAGAVVMLTVVYVAMRGMGSNLGDFLAAIGDWAKGRGDEIRNLP